VLGHAIGEGGMGIVYRGWLYYNPAGRLVSPPPHPIALKILHPLIRGRARAERLFRHEAEIAGKLSHPNIVHCFGLFEHDGELCIAMELVQGESLAELIERAGAAPVGGRGEGAGGPLPRLPYAQAWHYLAQLLGALESLHSLGVVHRDVKSANVLIRTDGIAKLTDFGIARLPEELAKQSGGLAPGTGAYMPPEQVLAQPLDPRADLYAAAIVMFEMLTGTTPFDSAERNEMMVRAAQLDEAPPPVTRLVPGAPNRLDLVFARALAKNKDLRYDSARALGEAFRVALGLPDSPGWKAQAELSRLAKTLSMSMPQAPESVTEKAVPPTVDDPVLAQVESEADRYRTDVMTSFKKG
jgi:serine/threonine-protein kinase